MSHELEQIIVNDTVVTNFAFAGKRADIWHRLGQQYDGRLMTAAEADPHPVLDSARNLLKDRYGISHAMLQVEPDTHHGCAEVRW